MNRRGFLRKALSFGMAAVVAPSVALALPVPKLKPRLLPECGATGGYTVPTQFVDALLVMAMEQGAITPNELRRFRCRTTV
jgi:hypothetical protein